MIWTVPNYLTIGRVLAAPFVALAFVMFDRPYADAIAFVIFVGAALTDFLDGWIARRFNQMSGFGKMLDPIADKAMVVIALMVLAALNRLSPMFLIPAAVILLREVLISGMREYLAGRADLSVTRLAKWKTTVQMLAIAALFLHGASGGLETVGLLLLWVAAVLTAITGWDYFSKGVRHILSEERR